MVPTILGAVKQVSGSFATGFVLLAVFAFVALGALRMRVRSWRETEALALEA